MSRHGRRSRHWSAVLFNFLMIIGVVLFVRFWLCPLYEIPTASMTPTLPVGAKIVVVNKRIHNPKRGEIVVFNDPGNWLTQAERDQYGSHYLVKRIIGVGGDHVWCKGAGNPVMVNGMPLNEPYAVKDQKTGYDAFDVHVPQGDVWVMGDNRPNSADSRYHEVDDHDGSVPMSDVIGSAVLMYSPVTTHGLLLYSAGDTFDSFGGNGVSSSAS